MSFTAPLFYLGLAVAGIVFYAIPGRLRAPYLLAVSYAFYALSSRVELVLLLAASAASYAIGLGIADGRSEKTRSRLMMVGVGGLVAGLVAFKAAGAATGFLLPLGLSFYSFKLIAYLVEVYWDEAAVERDPVIFLLYPAFFPQIVSGPIQRPGAFFVQMREIAARAASDAQIEAGFRLILGGLMLKLLVGDRLADVIGRIDAAHGDFTRATVVAAVGLYTLQLYADFAGYTNIALGAGKLFGVDGPPNFNAPFAATTIPDMWRRWHMSLTSWVTDYLFTPLSMALRGQGQAGLVVCITLNMAIIGLWHGLTLNFLVFGLLHAAFVVTTVFVARWFARRAAPDAPRDPIARAVLALAGMTLTFALMSFSQIFWRAPTWSQAVSVMAQTLGFGASGALGFGDLGPGVVPTTLLCAAAALYDGAGRPGAGRVSSRIDAAAPRWLQYGVCLFALSTLTSAGDGRFIYGQF